MQAVSNATTDCMLTLFAEFYADLFERDLFDIILPYISATQRLVLKATCAVTMAAASVLLVHIVSFLLFLRVETSRERSGPMGTGHSGGPPSKGGKRGESGRAGGEGVRGGPRPGGGRGAPRLTLYGHGWTVRKMRVNHAR